MAKSLCVPLVYGWPLPAYTPIQVRPDRTTGPRILSPFLGWEDDCLRVQAGRFLCAVEPLMLDLSIPIVYDAALRLLWTLIRDKPQLEGTSSPDAVWTDRSLHLFVEGDSSSIRIDDVRGITTAVEAVAHCLRCHYWSEKGQ